MMNHEDCWKAVEGRDGSQAGEFYFGVLTTGVYCRPGCPSRLPLRRNVRFYASTAAAERDGLRPCKRCRPLDIGYDPAAESIRELCRYIDRNPEAAPNLAELAGRASMSRFHLHRTFKAVTGVTPKEYAEAARMRKLKGSLRDSRDVTEAVYDAGFGSSSRVYERADTRLGMTPKQYRQGGEGVSITYATARTAVGMLLIGATDRGLCSVQFGDSREALEESLRAEYPAARIAPMMDPPPAAFQGWLSALEQHLAGNQPSLDLPLDVRATAFQMRVWKYLQSIPYGEAQSYGEVAAGIGSPSAVRAVARACATNPVAIAIPCHRVIRGTGELGGYRWGIERKRALLDRERSARTHMAGLRGGPRSA